MTVERMSYPITEIKLSPDETAGMRFSGYAAVFNNVDAYGDVIKPGAFAETLAYAARTGNWPAMLMQHGGLGINADDMTPVGIWEEMSEDNHGLKVAGQLADTVRGREAYTLLKMEPRPALNGISIGYKAKEWENRTRPEEPRRSLKKIHVFEASLVTFPANDKARIQSVKSIDDLSTLAEVERFLREAMNMSRAEAKHLVARIKAADPRDAGDDLATLAASITRNINVLKG